MEVTHHLREGVRSHGDRAIRRRTVALSGGAIDRAVRDADIIPAGLRTTWRLRRLRRRSGVPGGRAVLPRGERRQRPMPHGGWTRIGRGPVRPHAEASRGPADEWDRQRDRYELSE